MTTSVFGGRVPESGQPDPADQAIRAAASQALDRVAAHIERVELRAGLRTAMEAAGQLNAYLNATEPWKTAKTDRERTATVLKTTLDAINHLKVALAPYLPVTSERLHSMLGLPGRLADHGWAGLAVPAGTTLGTVSPLYTKVEAGSRG